LSNVKEMKNCNKKTIKKDVLAIKTEIVMSKSMKPLDYITNDKLQLGKRADARLEEGNSKVTGNSNCKKMVSRKTTPNNQFTIEEDDRILDAIKTYGEEINVPKLARELGRPHGSVYQRIKKLKNGESSRKLKRLFSLEEDLMVMDRSLSNLDGKLKDLVFHSQHPTMQELSASLARDAHNIKQRWESILLPWILQYH